MTMKRSALVAAALTASPAVLAGGPVTVDLRVGQALDLCAEQLARCPLQSSICDDPKIVVVEAGKAGPVLRGVSPGRTVCGLVGASGFRYVLQVNVKPKGADR